ncbi:helix-turn-helix transcriptional regulator [Burkholderia sp. BCCIQ04A]|uniref:Helix-turn-helix transcriptional regulator n=1 Tax=Burkholderia anthinoferrum TaxID=3090833 RepID=A0ABU5WNV0_9BURK|nr:helix-turn-helix transcriptional regulator [Burkholderia anthinoferrum]MEB2504609.1 helix-turn-helix transcriptional regulator [Burkholderia anthinoferrum]MEB2530278.1 helix-turn-helix transcriptional regulator [Burkholderia anthinoferrum]MEB2561651.1 helix-turn-helix transcriptional regulator [Burkholderia anthinoferrum]MEB2580599.1 helix-turn-helix transcriptional regulator [Burkholderia anthinoferrum]MEB2634423.1 helix-turn-helix transcriptional regulator [Burkholderia anthinoferrum]
MTKLRHPSADRLYEAAALLDTPITTQAEIARALNESEQTVNNWETRKTGISAQGCITIQKRLGISASWLLDGEGPMFLKGADHPPQPRRLFVSGNFASPEGQKLIDEIIAADKAGLPADAFSVLMATLKLFRRADHVPDGTVRGDESPL